jgi:hypothetical protein
LGEMLMCETGFRKHYFRLNFIPNGFFSFPADIVLPVLAFLKTLLCLEKVEA